MMEFRWIVGKCAVGGDKERNGGGRARQKELNVSLFAHISCFRHHHWLRTECECYTYTPPSWAPWTQVRASQ